MNQTVNLDMNELKFLVTLIKTQSLSITANKLGMSLSTASRHLQDARNIFQDQLFMRSGQKMFPTTKMNVLLPDVERTISMLDQLVNSKEFCPEENKRFYRISALDLAYTMILDPAIAKCRKIAPKTGFQIVPFSTASFDGLRNGMLDMLIFGCDMPVHESIHKVTLGEFSYTLLMREGHPLYEIFVRKGSVDKKDVADYENLAVRSAFSRQWPSVPMPWFDDEFQQADVTVPYFLCGVLSIVGSDQVVLVPAPFADYAIDRIRGIVGVPFDPLTNRRWTPTLFWHERTHNEPEMQWLRGIIQSSFKFFISHSTPFHSTPRTESTFL